MSHDRGVKGNMAIDTLDAIHIGDTTLWIRVRGEEVSNRRSY